MRRLHKVRRRDLNLDKYTTTLNNSLNYRIYAEYWYLDVLTNKKWEVWVYGDYEVLMPVPLQYKFGIRFVLQPFYCQQLGVFYKEEINPELFKAFEKKLHRNLVRAYQFNEENTARFNPKGNRRINYLLILNRPYQQLFNDFERDRKKDIRRCEKQDFKIVTDQFKADHFLNTLSKFYPDLLKQINVELTKSIIAHTHEHGCARVYSLTDANENHVVFCILFQSKKRLILLFSARNKDLEIKGSFAYLLSNIIREHSNQDFILDFEGSTIPGIAAFNGSFGAQAHSYTRYSNIKL